MILVRNIRLPLSAGEPQAFEKALREARIPRAKVQHLGVAKLAVDARRGQAFLHIVGAAKEGTRFILKCL